MKRRALSAAERLDWCCLARSENVGPITFFELLRHFGTANAALEAVPGLAARGGRRRPIKLGSRSAAEKEIRATEKRGARLIGWIEPDYPIALAAIPGPPPLITVHGHGHLLGKEAVAMVGARNASANGKRLTAMIAAELGAAGFAVVSGMARGIDAAAHSGALESGTIAVLAGGIDNVYPAENKPLYDEIIERGLIASEMPLGTRPRASHFPRRNRIISGLARGVIVVEAARRSGSLITVRFALEQGREVFAVPGSPLDPRAAGPNHLIREGALLIENAADVIEHLRQQIRTLDQPQPDLFEAGQAPEVDEISLTKGRPAVLELLGPAPVAIDELLRQTRLTPAVLVTILLELELAGRLDRHPGNQVSIIATDR